MARVTRRTLLKAGLIGVPALATTAGAGAAWLYASADVNTAGAVDFTNPLTIPPLAASRRDSAGRRVFDLRISEGSKRFRPGPATRTWGIDGNYLGPTLRAARGETVLINLRNTLPEVTSMHWHGMHLPAAMDGGPHQPIEPGSTWSPTWTIDQPATTLWYHPHPHQRTARHVYRGLAGLFLIDDPEALPDGVPNQYGVDDIPVIVQDRRFADDNQFDESHPMLSEVGLIGDTILVNGTYAPFQKVVTQRVRLRLLNASNARVYDFGFADDRPFALIGTDGGLLAAPHETNRIRLSPAERAEIVVTVRAGERLVLRSFPPELGVNFWDERFSGGDDTLDILELRAAKELAPARPLPARLAEAAEVDVSSVAATRSFELSGFKINDKSMDMARVDVAVAKDSAEIWEITAIDGVPHNFHVHDVQFQVLSVGGAAPPPELRGWKDTIFTPPNVPVRIAMRFTDYVDPTMPYMYHCHILYHEDQGLMGQFVVVEPGMENQALGRLPGAAHHHG